MIIKIARRAPRPADTFSLCVAGLALLGGLVRALSVPPLLPDLDSINFARALNRFDLAEQSPHFPGYPLYVALGRAAHASGAPDTWALAIPGIALAPVAIWVMVYALRPTLGGWASLGAALVFAFAPLLVLTGGAPASDGAAAAALAIAVGLALRLEASPAPERTVGVPDSVKSSRTPAAFLAGLGCAAMLGLRPSHAAAALGLVFVVPPGARTSWLVGVGTGVSAWLFPVWGLTGVFDFPRIAGFFFTGHVTEWGGTLAVAPSLGDRLSNLTFALGPAGLGLPSVDAMDLGRVLAALALTAVLGWGLFRMATRAAPASHALLRKTALWAAPYLLWVFVGQNLLKARHAAPLIVAMAFVTGAALATALATATRYRAWPRMAAVALGLALATVTVPLALQQGAEASPAARLMAHVRATQPASGLQLFTGEEARLFEHYAPEYRAGRIGNAQELVNAASRLRGSGVQVLVTSSAPFVSELGAGLEPIARFFAPRVLRSHANDLTLYRYRAGP